MIICMLWLVKQSTLTWLLLSFMFQWLLFKWGWGVSKEVRPGSATGQRFQFREKFAILQKVLPAWWASLGPPEMREERESEHNGGCEAISVGHFYLISPFYFNEWHHLCVPVAGCLMVWGVTLCSVWHSHNTTQIWVTSKCTLTVSRNSEGDGNQSKQTIVFTEPNLLLLCLACIQAHLLTPLV